MSRGLGDVYKRQIELRKDVGNGKYIYYHITELPTKLITSSA